MFSKLCRASLFASATGAALTSNNGQFHHHENLKKDAHKLNPNETLYVHVVPHSHDDVGWLKTVEEYYEGWRQDVQYTDVRNTITTVIH